MTKQNLVKLSVPVALATVAVALIVTAAVKFGMLDALVWGAFMGAMSLAII